MIFEHEIPPGCKLYFGTSAKTKRKIEETASRILYESGFEEIATPLFSYHQHLSVDDESELVRVGDRENNKVTLRADSTIDVVRLITKRLGRSTSHKRWFYIQPVFWYPTRECYQIGAEFLDEHNVAEVLAVVVKILRGLDMAPLLQLSNINIPKIIASEFGVALEVFKSINIETMLSFKWAWLTKLVYMTSPGQINEVIKEVPECIQGELYKIQKLCQALDYENLTLAPLYYAKMRYYDDLFFRFIDGNEVMAMGGSYKTDDIKAAGFALYTDVLIEKMMKN